MQTISRKLSPVDAAALQKFLSDPNRPEGTLQYNELQGFLFAIASSPETVPTSDWLPLISDDEDIDFKDEKEAQKILNNVMALYNQVNTAVLQRSDELPPGCEFKEDLFANFDEEASISQWSRGFTIGHDWLSEVWDEYLPEEMDEECGATTMVLSFFSSRQLAEAYFKESNPGRNRSGKTLENFAETVRELFPSALASYAHLGRTIFEVLMQRSPE